MPTEHPFPAQRDDDEPTSEPLVGSEPDPRPDPPNKQPEAASPGPASHAPPPVEHRPDAPPPAGQPSESQPTANRPPAGPPPVDAPPTSSESASRFPVSQPADEPAAGQLRGRHVAWARLLLPSAPADPEPSTVPLRTHSPPPAPTPQTSTRPAEPPARPAPEPHAARPSVPAAAIDDATDIPSAVGRLVALIVTLGLGWALAVAVGVWLLVYLVSRAAG